LRKIPKENPDEKIHKVRIPKETYQGAALRSNPSESVTIAFRNVP